MNNKGQGPDGLHSIISEKYPNTAGIVVIKDGQTAYEDYFNGADKSSALHVASATKSVVSALVGIAIDMGCIKSEQQRLADYFSGAPEWITIGDLLNMRVPYRFEDWREPLDRLSMSPDWVRFALDMIDDGGRVPFKYSTAGAHLLSAAISVATGKSAREFANDTLFRPAGMTLVEENAGQEFSFDGLFGSKLKGWAHDPQGISAGGWGLCMTARDMAAFGQVYLNGGAVNGKRIISEGWIQKTFTQNAARYGYLWWQIDDGVFAAMGDGGNMICCIPDMGITAAVLSRFTPGAWDGWELVRDYIIPAVG